MVAFSTMEAGQENLLDNIFKDILANLLGNIIGNVFMDVLVTTSSNVVAFTAFVVNIFVTDNHSQHRENSFLDGKLQGSIMQSIFPSTWLLVTMLTTIQSPRTW